MKERLNIAEKQGHLDLKIKGAKPIIACVGTLADFLKQEVYTNKHPTMNQVINTDNAKSIDWFADYKKTSERGFLSTGAHTYVISSVDESNKFSDNLFRCTGLVVTGIDKYTGNNISFMTHQDPAVFLGQEREQFIKHLAERLEEIKKRCKKGTIDAVIAGGTYFDHSEDKENDVKQRYLDSISLIGEEVKDILGFVPIVINGPKDNGKDVDDIFFDNDTRRLYFERSKVQQIDNPKGAEVLTADFPASDIEKYKNRFK